MKAKAIFPKVAVDLYIVQLVWSFSFLGILLFLQIAKPILAMIPLLNMNDKINVSNYFDTVFVSSNIFMLVIGIIAILGFLPYYVSNGVTRKDYFKGAAIAAAGLAISIPIVASVIYALQIFIMKITNFPLVQESSLAKQVAETDDGFAGDLIQSIIFTPFVELESNWILAIAVFALNIFTYYIVGWLIGTGFYRFGVFIGLLCIALAFIVVYIQDLLLSIALDLPVHDVFTSLDFSLYLAFAGALALAAITLWIIRQMTKRVPIKM